MNLKNNEEKSFLYSFTTLDVNIRGCEYCRSIVVVDGIHCKSTSEGTMLIESTLDSGGMLLFCVRMNLIQVTII